MQKHTPHADLTKTAIGYVRVSTQEQATEGVSLDAQRDKLRAYCKTNGIKLVDTIADEGISGSTLERPGLQAALRMIRRGRANTLIVAKLDRLSRSLRDVCALVGDYFTDERYHLLSCCGMVNTHSAAGRMLMMNLANYNEFERAMIAERTRETLQHLKEQGIRLGPAPYGYELSNQLDENGRRMLVPLASEQEIIARLAARALELRAENLSLRLIGLRLRKEGLVPLRGGQWHPAMVAELLRHRDPGDRAGAAERACELRAQGMSLREIGVRLALDGHVPEQGGNWYPARVAALLASAHAEH